MRSVTPGQAQTWDGLRRRRYCEDDFLRRIIDSAKGRMTPQIITSAPSRYLETLGGSARITIRTIEAHDPIGPCSTRD